MLGVDGHIRTGWSRLAFLTGDIQADLREGSSPVAIWVTAPGTRNNQSLCPELGLSLEGRENRKEARGAGAK